MIKSLTTRKGQTVYYDDETKEIIKSPSIACYLIDKEFVKILQEDLKDGNTKGTPEEST